MKIDFTTKGILFDMDGVIIDSQQIKNESAIEIIKKEFNLEIESSSIYKKYNGMRFIDYLESLLKDCGVKSNLSKVEIKELGQKRDALFLEKVESNINPIPGVLSFIKAAHNNGIKLAIASGSSKKFILKVVQSLDIEKYFSSLLSSYEVENGKPYPDVYLESAKRLGIKTENCVVIEDAIAGMISGKKAGCRVVGFIQKEFEEGLKNKKIPADWIVKSFDEIKSERGLKDSE